jgi:hypothetical protein
MSSTFQNLFLNFFKPFLKPTLKPSLEDLRDIFFLKSYTSTQLSSQLSFRTLSIKQPNAQGLGGD